MMEITQGMIDKLACNGQLQAAIQEHMTSMFTTQQQAEAAEGKGQQAVAKTLRERADFHNKVAQHIGSYLATGRMPKRN